MRVQKGTLLIWDFFSFFGGNFFQNHPVDIFLLIAAIEGPCTTNSCRSGQNKNIGIEQVSY